MGKILKILPHCHSTNLVAAEMIQLGNVAEGALVYTDNQSNGRGQRGNIWESEPGMNLTFSLVLRPNFMDIKDQFNLNIMASVAITRMLKKEISGGVTVKWPNDIYVRDFKIAGILIENSVRSRKIEHSIVGIGLNVNQHKFKTPKATSMKELTLKHYDLLEVLEKTAIHLEKAYLDLRDSQSLIKMEYLNNMYWMEEPHLFKDSEVFIGRIKGIDPQGKLLVQRGDQEFAYDIKEVEFLE
ncbi:MAG: biotin--[acetyl-CoA-carboxylase] ligase [Bacteroidetes bacterium]|nr:biotin--[acetyl-CoA-carboxylase] ligase [Bacteroidota bacterium]